MPRYFAEVDVQEDGTLDLPEGVDTFAVVDQPSPGRVVVETPVKVRSWRTRKNRDADYKASHPVGLSVPDDDPEGLKLGEPVEVRRARAKAWDEHKRGLTKRELKEAQDAAVERRRKGRKRG